MTDWPQDNGGVVKVTTEGSGGAFSVGAPPTDEQATEAKHFARVLRIEGVSLGASERHSIANLLEGLVDGVDQPAGLPNHFVPAPTAKQVADWLENNGFHNAGPGYVTLPDYDGDEGIRFHGSLLSDDPLGDAIAHAQRFTREVQNADDVGAEESNRQVEAWLATNGHDAPQRPSETPEAPRSAHRKGCAFLLRAEECDCGYIAARGSGEGATPEHVRDGRDAIDNGNAGPSLVEVADIIADLTDDDACSFDHHGNCQTHRLQNPCSNMMGRQWLAWNAERIALARTKTPARRHVHEDPKES